MANMNASIGRLMQQMQGQQRQRPLLGETTPTASRIGEFVNQQAQQDMQQTPGGGTSPFLQGGASVLDQQMGQEILRNALQRQNIQQAQRPATAQSVEGVQSDQRQALGQLAQVLPNQGVGQIASGVLRGAAVGQQQEAKDEAADEFNTFLEENPSANMEDVAAKADEIGQKHNIPRLRQKAQQLRQRGNRRTERQLQQQQADQRRLQTGMGFDEALRGAQQQRFQNVMNQSDQAIRELDAATQFRTGDQPQPSPDQTEEDGPQQTSGLSDNEFNTARRNIVERVERQGQAPENIKENIPESASQEQAARLEQIADQAFRNRMQLEGRQAAQEQQQQGRVEETGEQQTTGGEDGEREQTTTVQSEQVGDFELGGDFFGFDETARINEQDPEQLPEVEDEQDLQRLQRQSINQLQNIVKSDQSFQDKQRSLQNTIETLYSRGVLGPGQASRVVDIFDQELGKEFDPGRGGVTPSDMMRSIGIPASGEHLDAGFIE